MHYVGNYAHINQNVCQDIHKSAGQVCSSRTWTVANGDDAFTRSLRWLLQRPHSNALIFRYNSYTSSVVHCGSEVENVHEEPNATIYSMCEMPFDVLYAIVDYLDSGSLRCLSAVNRQMRKFCFIYFNHLAMVHIKWMKSDTNHWFRKCFVSFTFLYIINHRQRYHHFTNYFMQFQLTGFCQLVRAGHCFGWNIQR